MRMNFPEIIVIMAMALVVIGCQTAGLKTNPDGTLPRQSMDTIKSAVKDFTGRDVTDNDIYRIANEIRSNSETQSAVEAVTHSMTQKPVIFYCPVDGKRFAASIKVCPQHQTSLKLLE